MTRSLSIAVLCVISAWLLTGCGKRPSTDRDQHSPPHLDEPPTLRGNEAKLNEWSQVGDVRVKIVRAKVEKVPLKSRVDKSAKLSPESELVLWVEVQNLSTTKTIRYRRWGQPATGGVIGRTSIADEHGNTYAIKQFEDGIEAAHETGIADLRPNDPQLTDIICVARPADTATVLEITLAPLDEGYKETHRFKIPSSAWR